MEPDEYELALRARAGDRDALAQLVERTRVGLFSLAYAELRHYEDAHDAVAAALLRVCRHIHELQEPARVRAWMQSIVRNEARRLRHAPEPVIVGLEEEADPLEETGPALLRLDIERALRQLPGEQERVLRLFYLEEQSIDAIARREGRPEGTIKSWLHRGRQRLALEMEAYAPMAATPTATTTPPRTAALIHTDLDAATVRKVTKALKTGGYRTKVLTSRYGGQLLETLKKYQVIVLDEWIGGRSALEFLLNIKARPGLKETPLALLCADPEDFAVSAYFTAGVTHLVNKNNPGDLSKLAGPFEKPTPGLWSLFTERARRVVFFSQEEAARLGTNMVSSEHLLLGMIRESDSVAGRILVRLGAPADRIRTDLEQNLVKGEGAAGEMLLTADAKRSIDLCYEEVQRLQNDYVGTEHLLLGLIRAGDTLASRTLVALGADLERARREVDASLEAERPPAPMPASPEVEGLTQRFTEKARRSVFLAQEEARRLGESFVGTEHLLLGLLGIPDSVGAQLLPRVGISLESIRAAILQEATRGPGSSGQPELTPRAKRVIELAWEEARQLQHNYIGTEHLILGLLREHDGLAARVLVKLGAELERLRREVEAQKTGQ